MKSISSNKGQGLIEALMTLPLLVLTTTAFIFLIYRAMVFYFADYQLHEALICTKSLSLASCKQELNDRLNKILITNPKTSISLTQQHSFIKGEILIELHPSLFIEKKVIGTTL
ncbi:MAG: hypothetical protein ACXVCY_16470 [Pseudobdellovibrionaceae bacterium]